MYYGMIPIMFLIVVYLLLMVISIFLFVRAIINFSKHPERKLRIYVYLGFATVLSYFWLKFIFGYWIFWVGMTIILALDGSIIYKLTKKDK